MDKAADHARQGDLQYFLTLDAATLAHLVRKTDEDGRSLLHAAASSGNIELVQFLLDKGCQDMVETQDDEGWAPLHSAVSAGHASIVELLISCGASVNIANSGQRTPLHYAASKGLVELVKLLLSLGAHVNATDVTGSTALHRAASAGKQEVVRLLVEQGKAQIDAKDKVGNTPLLIALECEEANIAVFLAAKGADLHALNKDEQSPLSIAGTLTQSLQAAKRGEIDVDHM